MSETVANVDTHSATRYWPFAAAGLSAPLAAAALNNWMSLHLAAGLAFFVLFAAADWLFQRSAFPTQKRSLARSLASGLAGGVVVGLLTYLNPWR